MLLLGLALGGLSLTWLSSIGNIDSAIAETTSPARGLTHIPAAMPSPSQKSQRIALKLVAGAHLATDAPGQLGSQAGDSEVSEVVTAKGHRLDLSEYALLKDVVIDALGVQVLDVPDQANLEAILSELRLDPGVAWAQSTQTVYASGVPNDPYYYLEWAPPKVGMPTAWDVTPGSATVTIAVVDTGLDGTIADFSGRIVSPYSVVDGSGVWPYWDDTAGHGTAVAGVAASQGNNASGIAGMAWNVKIMPVKISESGTSDDVILSQGIVYAVDHGADVINISFGGPQGSSTMASAVSYALSHGVVVVASAGNSGPGSGISYPAAYSSVISVGATDSNDNVASFSSTGPGLVLSAPGVSILTWNPNAGGSMLSYWSGTSFASPLVAGVAALMVSANSSLTPTQVAGILEQTALDRGTAGVDQAYGYGRVRADAAVAAAVGQSTTTTASSTTTTFSSPTSSTSTTLSSGGTVRYEQTDSRFSYSGTWPTSNGVAYSGGSMKQTSSSGSSVTIRFTGTSLKWIASRLASAGVARVTLDGAAPVMIDLYGARPSYKQGVWASGVLANGTHTVTIAWTGQKSAAATGTSVNIDAMDVTGTVSSAGILGAGGQIL